MPLRVMRPGSRRQARPRVRSTAAALRHKAMELRRQTLEHPRQTFKLRHQLRHPRQNTTPHWIWVLHRRAATSQQALWTCTTSASVYYTVLGTSRNFTWMPVTENRYHAAEFICKYLQEALQREFLTKND